MDALIYTAMSGAETALRAQQVHANNLANLDTGGFRASLTLSDAQDLQSSYGYDDRHQSQLQANAVSVKPGPIKVTGRDLDVAIAGSGFIAVDGPGGEAYTRAGAMNIDADGTLMLNGSQVVGDGGPIVVPINAAVQVGEDGTVSILSPGSATTDMQPIGKIKLVNAEGSELAKNDAGLLAAARHQQAGVVLGQFRAFGVDQLDLADRLHVGGGRGNGRHHELEPQLRSADEDVHGHRHDDPGRQQAYQRQHLTPASPPAPPHQSPPDQTGEYMNPAMWISKTGVQAQDEKLQAIANNLANAQTVGFKKDRVVFEDLFYSVEQQPGTQRADNNTLAPTGVQLGNGTHMIGTQKVFTQGATQTTGNTYDVEINGNGFLQVRQPNGDPAYTRAGQLGLDQNGILINAQGLPIVPQITVPANATALTIGQNGVVTATIPGSTTGSELGQLTLTSFINPTGLLALGGNLFQETASSGAPTEGKPGDAQFGTLQQGALEGSNVQVVEEMVDMIAAQRTYEMNTKVLTAADTMLDYLAQAAR